MSKEPEETGPGLSGEMSLDPVDSELVGSLDQLVDALQDSDGEARTVLLTDRPELAQYVECLTRLDALFPWPAVADTGHPDFDSTESPGSSRKGGDRVGTRFGRYELVERIGHGAMGVVYHCYDPQLHRTVAVKMILEAGGADDG